jgi:hypothetical protein
MDRRTTIQWMLAATGALAVKGAGAISGAAATTRAALVAAPGVASTSPEVRGQPYGTDPNLLEIYHPGDLWPLTFTATQRRTATMLCDLIIPADAVSPSASGVGVVEFVDEWISAPYPPHEQDRRTVLGGFEWLKAESARRLRRPVQGLEAGELGQICDDICYLPRARSQWLEAARFFARYRDLTAGGFYTTPAGRKDLQYIGNTPLARFDGPPMEVLKKVGLA